MIDPFLVSATLAGLGVALIAAPLGCFVVWRRMAYFGDAIAHASILGVAVSLGFSVSPAAGVLVVALMVGTGVAMLSDRGVAADTLLGVAAHGGLALGMVALSLARGGGRNAEDWLFGEILTVGPGDLVVIWGGAVLVGAVLWRRWSRMLLTTLSADLARAEGIDPRVERLILTVLIAVLVAVAIRVVGALLITAMLIVPAATARARARTPEGMAALAALVGGASTLLGIAASMRWDLPAGPAIVSVAVFLFLASRFLASAR